MLGRRQWLPMPGPPAQPRWMPMSFTMQARALLALPFALLVAGCGDGSDPIGPVATLPVAAVQLDAVGDSIAPIMSVPVLRTVLMAGFARGLPFDGFGGEFVPMGARATTLASVSGTRWWLPGWTTKPTSLRGCERLIAMAPR